MIRIKTVILGFLLLFVYDIFAEDPFVLPREIRVINRDNSGKTWQMNGVVNLSFSSAKKELSDAVQKAGFKLKHEIQLNEKNKEHILLSWTKKRQTLIMMLWTAEKNTFFSWGIVNE